MHDENLWVIVLAAGEGRRLSALTTDARGVPVPKQFCSFGRERPMVQWALDRAKGLAPVERIVTIVATEHRRWWETALSGLPDENVIVQPRNRGTAAGILLPLIEILRRDPHARVVLLPSDHYVADEAALGSAAQRAVKAVQLRPERVVLLGITPDDVETEYGWILPRSRRGPVHPVARFVEKPDARVAADLLGRGAVWNSFVLAGAAKTLLYLYDETLPDLAESFLRELVVLPRPGGLEALYADLPTNDFSRELLERVADRLDVVVAPPCGWSDLGTPARLRTFLETPRGLQPSRPAALSA